MTDTGPVPGATAQDQQPKEKGRLKAKLLPFAMRHGLLRRAIGIQVVYRSAGGGLIASGLSYATLFALIPTLILVVAGIFLLVDDPSFREDAIEFINSAFPAFSGLTDEAVEGARDLAAVGGVIALIGFLWGASGLYLNLTRAMERFFPGERVGGAIARVVGVLLVVVIIVAVLVGVLLAGVVTVLARALGLDAEWVLTAISAAATLAVATGIVYVVYRLIPANPPTAASARTPALLVGLAIALMTLLYGLISPWLVSGFQAFGVAASIFVALIWLRVVFLAMTYGAAMARYLDYVAAAETTGAAEPDRYATEHALREEADRAEREYEHLREFERQRTDADPPEAPSGEG